MSSRALQQCLMAISYFTRLPVPINYDPALNAGMPKYLPAIGWIVGGIFALSFAIGQWLLPLPVAVILSLILCLAATGALHEDGFADYCDGFGGGWDKDNILRIMKDSHLGSYGVLGLLSAAGLIACSIMYLPAEKIAASVCAAHVLSRFTALTLIFTLPYARPEGSTKTPELAMQQNDLWVALAFTAPALLLLPFGSWAYVLFGLWLIRHLMASQLRNKLGGYTGDCLGAAQLISFCVTLVIISSHYYH